MADIDIKALTAVSVPDDWTDLDRRAVDTIRVLAADAVQKVGNGHPGTAMSLAPLAYSLFQRVMRHDPMDTDWTGRDRFVLSCGHSSITLYIQLFLCGYGLELDDLKALRTWGSKTPGHPEYGHTRGVEITTGPLGQGLASAVGMAMAARRERGLFDPDAAPGESPFDHYIYVIASDGDIEEGVTSEASSLAGTQQLGNLIVVYDDNQISIEDDTTIALSEDTAKRYEAYGWHVQVVESGENVTGILDALDAAKAETSRPSFIVLKTVIGWPAPKKMNTCQAHGSALGAEEVAAVKKILGFDPEQSFEVDDAVLEHTREVVKRGQEAHAEWQKSFDEWAAREPERKELFDRLTTRTLPVGLGEGAAELGARPQGGLHPQGLRRGAERAGRRAARALGRLGRPRGEQQHHDGGPALVRPRAHRHAPVEGHAVRPHAALRHPRARDGRDPDRHRPARPDPPLRRHVPDLLRLHARRRAARVGDAGPGHLRVDARLDRARRGRADPPADRAHGRAAGDPGPFDGAPRRRQRDRGCLEGDPGAQRGAVRARADPPEHPGARGHVARGRRQGRLRPGRRVVGAPAGDPHRHRLGAADGRRGPRRAGGRRRCPRGSCRCRASSGSTSRTPPTARRCCPPTVKARVSRGGRDRACRGTGSPATEARTFPSNTSVRARIIRHCSASSGSPPRTWSRPPSAASRRPPRGRGTR